MNKLQCKVNDIFGYWQVIDNTIPSKNGRVMVRCRCKCGKIQDIVLGNLIRKKATGCRSCKARDRSIDIKIGDIYKSWQVISGPKVSNYQCVLWEVRCTECNLSTRLIQGNELTDNHRCFCCQRCAAKKRASKLTKRNGRVGDLTKNKYTKLNRSAKSRGILFTVSIEFLWELFVAQKNKCAITGEILININDASLDRIDSSIGYTEENVQWATKQANISKHVMSQDEFILFCRRVVDHADQQRNNEFLTTSNIKE